VLSQYRDVLDELVLGLLDKETLNQKELAEVFRSVEKRPARDVWLSSEQRTVHTRGPVLTPKELAAQNGHTVVPQDEAVLDPATSSDAGPIDPPN
jgi:cell division protease FtsH